MSGWHAGGKGWDGAHEVSHEVWSVWDIAQWCCNVSIRNRLARREGSKKLMAGRHFYGRALTIIDCFALRHNLCFLSYSIYIIRSDYANGALYHLTSVETFFFEPRYAFHFQRVNNFWFTNCVRVFCIAPQCLLFVVEFSQWIAKIRILAKADRVSCSFSLRISTK